MGKGLPKPSRSDRPDANHVPEFGVRCLHDRCDTSEVSEQRACANGRDVRNRREHCFRSRRLWALSVDRTVARRKRAGRPARDAVKPEGRVALCLAAHDCDAILGGREQRTTDCCRADRPGVENRSLDDKERPFSCCAQPPQLPPEPTGDERQVQVAHGLALDDGGATAVIAGWKSGDIDVGHKVAELLANPSRLVHVDLDANHLNPHAKIVPSKTSQLCAYRSREARTT